MAVPSVALAYRRTALMNATKVTVKPPSPEVLKARDNFQDFCGLMGKAPAKHMLEWHAELCTGVDSECLLGIGGPNTAILAPRGSAKSTVLGLFAAWMIGRHTAAKQMWSNVIAPTMFQGARAICLGTRFHFDDIHATLFVPKNNWKQIIQKAVITDADGRQRSYWPEFWSMKYLNERKMENRVAFAYQYLNTAVQSSDVGISPDLIIKGEVPEEYDCLGVGIDLSCGLNEKNDWTVFTLGGIKDGKIYLIDQRRVKSMGNLEKMDTLCEMLADWNIVLENDESQYFPTMSPCMIWPEAVAYQSSFEGDFKRVMFEQRALYNLSCSPVKGFKGDKLARLRGVLGLYEHRKVIWNKWRKWNILEDELINFGHSPHDDAVDSMVLTMGGLLRRGALHLEYRIIHTVLMGM